MKKPKLTEHEKLLIEPYRFSVHKKIIINHLMDDWWIEPVRMDSVFEKIRGEPHWVRLDPISVDLAERERQRGQPFSFVMYERIHLEGLSLYQHKRAWAGLIKDGYIAQVEGKWQVTEKGREFHAAYHNWTSRVRK